MLRATADLISAAEDRKLITVPESLVKARDVLRRTSATQPELPQGTEADAIFRAAHTVVNGRQHSTVRSDHLRVSVTAYHFPLPGSGSSLVIPGFRDGGRYWDRTSDRSGVNRVLSR